MVRFCREHSFEWNKAAAPGGNKLRINRNLPSLEQTLTAQSFFPALFVLYALKKKKPTKEAQNDSNFEVNALW